MKPKEKIIRILEENCVNFIYSDDESFNIDGVDKDNFNEVAKQIVEKLTSTDVVKSLRNKYKTDFDIWKIDNKYIKDKKHKCYFKGDKVYFEFDLIEIYDKELMKP